MIDADEPGWPRRIVMFVAIGAVAAFAIQQLAAPEPWHDALPTWRTAIAAGVGVGALAFGFGLSRALITWTVAFAVALGLVAGLIVWWNGEPQPLSWSGASLFLAIALAVPLFQTARDRGGRDFPYTRVHDHAWTNIVLWGACWAFAGLTLLLSHLLVELFALIGIVGPRRLLDHHWSNALIIGAAFGAALGMLRDRDVVVRLLQRVATSVLSVLAPVLAVALTLFIVSLPFTGLASLWEATKSTTPTLIACVIGALVLANTVIGNGPDDEARHPVLRWSALALGVVILPLAALAAVAMGLRIAQHGMTPDRLWGLVVVAFAVAYGLVYLIDAVRGRQDWAPLVRRDNVRLALATMAVALVLATPLVGFNALSAHDQVARLQSGRVSVAQFDWAALAFDFGEPGKSALANLRRSANPAIAARAANVGAARGRFSVAEQDRVQSRDATIDVVLRIFPEPVALPAGLRALLVQWDGCEISAGPRTCVVYYRAGANEAWLLQTGCFTASEAIGNVRKAFCAPQRFVMTDGRWGTGAPTATGANVDNAPARRAALDAGRISVRTVTRRQLFIGDDPVGDAVE